MAVLLYSLLILSACSVSLRADDADTKARVDALKVKLDQIDSGLDSFPPSNSTDDRLERIEILVNLLLEDVYDVRVDQELLKRQILDRLQDIEDKITENTGNQPICQSIDYMMANHYKDFRPSKNLTDENIPKVHRDCTAAYEDGWTQSGVYTISPDDQTEMDVYCDQVVDGGGWIVIQRRFDGNVDFGRGWAEYKNGFGDVSGEFWLGNENIHTLTTGRTTRLRVELQYHGDGFASAEYSQFSVDSESNKFQLHISDHVGDDSPGDSLLYHDGQYFSTKDRDNDRNCGSCAQENGGGWWYNNCTRANLNGVYSSPSKNGITWKSWTGYSNSFKSVRMMVKKVSVQDPVNGDLRLFHPTGCRTEGRVELLWDDRWGTVCDDSFGTPDALVACKQLGFARGMYLSTKIAGTGPIWLDSLACSSSHTRLVDCPHGGMGVHDCSHSEDTYIACYDGSYRVTCSGAYDVGAGNLRLVHPTECKTEGRLEMLWKGSWGTICNENFDHVDATVACRQLGFTRGIRMEWESAGSGDIWLDGVQCNVNDTSLMTCAHQPVGTHNCGHQQDVHIACFDGTDKQCCRGSGMLDTRQSTLRLVDGSCPDEGRLEIYHNNTWGTVCQQGFGAEEATVACQELGYHSGVPMKAPSPGAGTIWLDKLSCSPTHTSIEDCKTTDWGRHTCTHQQDAGVVCFSQP